MNTITVEFEDCEFASKHTKREIVLFIKEVLAYRNTDNVEFSVTFVEEPKMHEMNKQYRGIDSSTDILSFAFCDDVDGFSFVVAKRRRKNIGDIVICVDAMKANAKFFGVSEDEELKRLLVHGILHLSGFDHKSNDAAEPMLVLQENILKALSVI